MPRLGAGREVRRAPRGSSSRCRSGSSRRGRRTGPPPRSPPFAPPSPLQATSAWIGPSRSAAPANAFSTLPRSRMSHAATWVGCSSVAAVASSRPRSRASSVSDAPSRSSRRAIARPIPVPAPVTTMCFAVRSHVFSRRSQFAGKSYGAGLDPRARRSIDSSLRRARGAGGRSLAGRRYAEAEGRPAMWTKATRLGEFLVRLSLEHPARSAILHCCSIESSQFAGTPIQRPLDRALSHPLA